MAVPTFNLIKLDKCLTEHKNVATLGILPVCEGIMTAKFKKLRFSVLILALVNHASAIPIAKPVGDTWYLNAKFSCSDPLGLEAAYSSNAFNFHSLPVKVTNVTQQMGYLDLGFGNFNDLVAKGAVGGTVESTQLTKSQAASLRSILLNKSEHDVVPFIGQTLVSVIISFTLKAGTGLVAGTFFNYLFGELQTQSIPPRVLAEVVAEGGSVTSVLTGFRDKDQHPYAVHAFEYSVVIGSESRHYVTTACIYPVNATITQIKTLATSNNKIFKLQPNGTWRKWDITDSKFEDDPLIETNRDADFIYFTLNDPRDITNTQRISLKGGPWQVLQGGQWLTLCSKTQPL